MADAASPNDPTALRLVFQENLDEMLRVIDPMAPEEIDARLDADCWSVREILLHFIHSERWLQPQLLAIRRAVAPALGVPPDDSVTLPSPDAEPDFNELRWALNAVREGTDRLLDGLAAQQLREPANLRVEEAGDEASVDVSFRTMFLTAADHQLFTFANCSRRLADADCLASSYAQRAACPAGALVGRPARALVSHRGGTLEHSPFIARCSAHRLSSAIGRRCRRLNGRIVVVRRAHVRRWDAAIWPSRANLRHQP